MFSSSICVLFPPAVLDKTTQRHYALKLMSRTYIVDNGWEEMVEHERRAMMELAGVSIFLIDLYNTYCDKHYIYMLMELCTGGELYEHLCQQEHKSVSVGAMRFYSGCIFEGISTMHSYNIVYRDLKPENVILDESGYAKLVDYGLAKKTMRTYTVCGTPEYMAPEQVLSRGHDSGVDYWALGVMMYEMITGFTPFVGYDQMEIYGTSCEWWWWWCICVCCFVGCLVGYCWLILESSGCSVF